MPVLTLENVGSTGDEPDIFRGYCASIESDEKVGLVSPDDRRKSLLLRLAAGQSQPTAGVVWRADGLTVGYLGATAAPANPRNTVYDEMMTVFPDLRLQEARMRALEQQVQSGAYSQEVLDYYSRALERFQQAGGYDYEIRIGQVLNGLGFHPEDRDLPLNQMDQAGQRHALLARLLLAQPGLLVLDNPDAGLDGTALDWLVQTLRNWRGAVLLSTQNTSFLDAVAGTIWELGLSGITVYRGGYGGYLRGRAARRFPLPEQMPGA